MRKRILIVDDSVLARKTMRMLLGSVCCSVVGEAADGFEAVDKARKLAPDVVLMDLFMPGMDGAAATRVLSHDLPDTQIIVVSVSEAEEDMLKAMRAGARGYIVKTGDPQAMLLELRRVLSGEPPPMTPRTPGAPERPFGH